MERNALRANLVQAAESWRWANPTINAVPKPCVGIWWDTGKVIVALANPPTANVTRTGSLVDSNLSHADEWTAVAKKLGRTTEDEYFSVPRGRVLLDVDALTGIVLHGPATTRKRLELIARRLGLRDWRAELDAHYFTGEDADRLFDEGE